jgi:hypothetical protein
MDALNWRKASYSASNGGGCVEVADHDHRVLVRDTQDRTGPVLTVDSAAWRRFAGQVRRSLPSSRGLHEAFPRKRLVKIFTRRVPGSEPVSPMPYVVAV